jgi:hypothetical protein
LEYLEAMVEAARRPRPGLAETVRATEVSNICGGERQFVQNSVSLAGSFRPTSVGTTHQTRASF